MLTAEELVDLLMKFAIGSFLYFIFDSVMEMFFNRMLGKDWRKRMWGRDYEEF